MLRKIIRIRWGIFATCFVLAWIATEAAKAIW